MRLKLVLIAICMAAAAGAQPVAGITNASVSGVVKDAGTGQPLANYNVSTYVGATWINDTVINGQAKQVKSITDTQGRYKISDLPPGSYRIDATSSEDFGTGRQRRITLSGQDLEHLDFNVVVNGKISGKVVDENKEPVPDISVYLVSKEYYMGALGYFFKGTARTDDRGQYTLSRVRAGHPYFVMAEKRDTRLPPRSIVPLDPNLRRRVPLRSFHPNAPSKEGAEALVIRPGELREHVDIEMKRARNYCVDGTLMNGFGPATLVFMIEAQQPSSGTSAGGGMFIVPPNGTTGPDGKFRVCDLAPGTYRFTALDRMGGQPENANFAVANLVISDRDVPNVKLAVAPGLALDGEVVWDGDPPPTPVTTKINVNLLPLSRNILSGEKSGARTDLPSTFTFPSLVMGDYGIRTLINAPGLYVKDVTYAGISIFHEPLHLGAAVPGAGVRVVVAHDGATLGARVTDEDGNPVSAIAVLVMPANVASEAALQAMLVTGETDQTGQYTSHTLPPGKYYVAALTETFDATTDSIARLWRSRLKFKEVELPPSGAAQVTLVPLKIE